MVAYSKLQYLLAGVGARHGRSNAEIRRTQAQIVPTAPPISDHAIRIAFQRHALPGDAAQRKRRVDMGSPTPTEMATVISALAENCGLHTVSSADTLQKRLLARTGRTLVQSTIDDAVRALDLTDKVAERVHPGRDAVASAQVRQDLNSYPLLCLTNLDATHIAKEDYIPKRGRALRGRKAKLRANKLQAGGPTAYVARTLYAAMNTSGIVVATVIDGNVDNEVFLD